MTVHLQTLRTEDAEFGTGRSREQAECCGLVSTGIRLTLPYVVKLTLFDDCVEVRQASCRAHVHHTGRPVRFRDGVIKLRLESLRYVRTDGEGPKAV